jgi:nuclear pore complex protein Nup98-Nup96
VATNGQDTIIQNRKAYTIFTKHQCITAMKEYKIMSLEAIRFEDYQAKLQKSAFNFGSLCTSLPPNTTCTASTTFGSGPFSTSQYQNNPFS